MSSQTTKGKETKRRIMLAALQVFSENGFRDAKVSMIAKEAGIGKGTIYHHFDTKEQIIAEMVTFFLNEYFVEMEAIFLSENHFTWKLKQWINFNIACSNSHNSFVALYKSDGISMASDYQKIMVSSKKEIFEIVTRALKMAVVQGELSKIDDYDFAVAMMFGTIMQYFFCNELQDDDILSENRIYVEYNENSINSVCGKMMKMLEVI